MITISEKELKVDSLFNFYNSNKNFDYLFNDLYHNAIWHYRETSNLTKAIAQCDRAIDISNKLTDIDIDLLGRVMYNKGFFYEQKGDYNGAFLAYKDVTEHIQQENRVISAYSKMGDCKRSIGDFYEAADYYKLALSYSKSINTRLYVETAINASVNYKEISSNSSYKKGIDLLTKLIDEIENNIINSETISQLNLIKLYNNLGNLHSENLDFNFNKSKFYLTKALDLANKSKELQQHGYIYNDLGYLHSKAGKSDALNYLNDALKHLVDKETISICYSNKALYYANINDQKNTFLNIQKSISTLANFNDKNILNNPSKEELVKSLFKNELLTALIEKVEHLLKFNKTSKNKIEELNLALETVKIADFLVDNIRLESNEQKSKIFWRTISSRIYTNAVEICYKLNQPENALYYIEKNKAILLLEDINQNTYLKSADIPTNVITKYEEFKEKISDNTNFLTSKSGKVADSVRLQLIESRTTFNNFIDSLQTTSYGRYFKNINSTQILSLKDIQNNTDDETVNLNYILNDTYGFGIALTNDNHHLFKIENLDSFRVTAENFQELLVKPLNTKIELEQFNKISKQLYAQLIPNNVQGLIKDKTLVISPDYYLQNIPFETLKDQTGNYLIESHIISYTYSFTFLDTNSKIKRNNTKNFVGFAPVDFNNLTRLEHTKNELEQVSKIYKGDNFYNNNATKEKFKNRTKDYDIIHLATHANANDSLRPWIAFHDKILSLDELYLTKNSAELVILSACETGLGEIKQGEGVMSLARGFFNTGANSVISSLWSVNDKSSSEIIINFYKNLEDGDTKSQALHKAKLNYINSKSLSEQSPYYWSSFVLIGNTDAITLNSSNYWIYVLIGISLLLILLLAKRKK